MDIGDVVPYSQVIAPLVTLLASSVTAALLAIYRSRKQGIYYSVESTPVFTTGRLSPTVSVTLNVDVSGNTTKCYSLYITKVSVRNGGNIDYSNFKLAINLGYSGCIHIDIEKPSTLRDCAFVDRAPSVSQPVDRIVLLISDFHRDESWNFTILSQYGPNKVTLESDKPVKFINYRSNPDSDQDVYLFTLLAVSFTPYIVSAYNKIQYFSILYIVFLMFLLWKLIVRK